MCASPVDGLSDVRNVKDFGAVGDGVTDDTAAFQAAIDDLPDAGGVVSIPPGTYMVGNLQLKSGTNLVGCGRATVLKARPGAGTVIGMAGGVQDRIRISDLVIDGNKQDEHSDAHGLYLSPHPDGTGATTNLVVERVYFRNHKYYAILIGQGDHRNLLFRDVDILTTDKTGIRIESGSDIWIDRAHIQNVGSANGGYGIGTTRPSAGVHNLSITNSTIAGSGHHNIYLCNTGNVRIENNYLYFAGRIDGSGSGIQAEYGPELTGLTVIGNTIEDSQGYAICAAGVHHFVMVGNSIKGGRDPGIRVSGGSTNWLISGNTITGVNSIGLLVVPEPADQSFNATISGNVIQGCCMSGLVVGGQNISITGNTIVDNATWQSRAADDAAACDSGVGLEGAKHVIVMGNRIGNTPGKSSQAYGIFEHRGADFNSIYGNDLTNNALGSCITVGANTNAWANQGVTDE